MNYLSMLPYAFCAISVYTWASFLLFIKLGHGVLVFMFSTTKEVNLYNSFSASFSLVITNIPSPSHLYVYLIFNIPYEKLQPKEYWSYGP